MIRIPALGLVPAPKCIQKVVGSHVSVRSCSVSPDIALVPGDDDDTAVVGEEDTGHLDDKETLS